MVKVSFPSVRTAVRPSCSVRTTETPCERLDEPGALRGGDGEPGLAHRPERDVRVEPVEVGGRLEEHHRVPLEVAQARPQAEELLEVVVHDALVGREEPLAQRLRHRGAEPPVLELVGRERGEAVGLEDVPEQRGVAVGQRRRGREGGQGAEGVEEGHGRPTTNATRVRVQVRRFEVRTFAVGGPRT